MPLPLPLLPPMVAVAEVAEGPSVSPPSPCGWTCGQGDTSPGRVVRNPVPLHTVQVCHELSARTC